MDPVTTFSGSGLPLDRSDVDTDQIIPAKYLKRIERTGYGPFAFEAWAKDPDFVTNQPQYDGASILLAGPNFGCGSSREHAVWAIQGMGVRAVIAPSFADIFRNNSAKMGLLTIQLSQPDVEELMRMVESESNTPITVNLADQTVTAPGGWSRSFEIAPFVKHRLLNGLDDISLTLEHDDLISDYESNRPSTKPVTV